MNSYGKQLKFITNNINAPAMRKTDILSEQELTQLTFELGIISAQLNFIWFFGQ